MMSKCCILISYCYVNGIFPININQDIYIINYDPLHIILSKNSYVKNGYKWENILWFLETNEIWKTYDYIWLPDDDLKINEKDIDIFFEFVTHHKLNICQPSLKSNNNVSHKILQTKTGNEQQIRKIDFVENQMPCFKKEFVIVHLLPFLQENRKHIETGWGIDIWWSKMFNEMLYIIDDIIVEHTRRVNTRKLCYEQRMFFIEKYKI
jgi:hypothetical protein